MGIFQNNENIIVGRIKIIKDNLKQRIINSYENTKLEESAGWAWDYINIDKNEKEIKECEIYINNKKIIFDYYYTFPKEGDYIIKYIFKNLLKSTSFMFYHCYSITSLDLSKFKTDNITNMSSMFYDCRALTFLNLSNFNTSNVIDMGYMFRDCNSLISLDLSSFNTQNVVDMKNMFFGCRTLTSLNLSNFNTQNLANMRFMFRGCSSLMSLNLSNFNIKNVVNMRGIFIG